MTVNLPAELLHPTPRQLRQFAAGWFVFFLGLGVYQYGWQGRTAPALGCGAAAVIGAGLAWLRPALFRWVFAGSMLLAYPVGWLSSQLVLALMFYGVITPLALLFRLVRRDRLKRFKPTGAASYWRAGKTPPEPRSYFRPY